jgi:hypothetical protein
LDRLRKGQVWSYDLIVGSIIFVIAMGILAFFWWSARTNISENKDAMVAESAKVSDVLMSPGIPANWNMLVKLTDQSTWANVQQIGLAEDWGSNILSIDKLYKFTNMSLLNYPAVKSKIRSRYNFYMELKLRNNSVEVGVKMNGTNIQAGLPYNELTAKTIAKTDRVAVYNNTVVILKLYIWSDSLQD